MNKQTATYMILECCKIRGEGELWMMEKGVKVRVVLQVLPEFVIIDQGTDFLHRLQYMEQSQQFLRKRKRLERP